MQATKALLFRDETDSVFLLDIPTSIAHAQRFTNEVPLPQLISCEPLSKPYPNTEPKSEAASKTVSNHIHDETLHSEIEKDVRKALETVKSSTGEGALFCNPRRVGEQARTRLLERKAENTANDEPDARDLVPSEPTLTELFAEFAGGQSHRWKYRQRPFSRAISEGSKSDDHAELDDEDTVEPWDSFIQNDSGLAMELQVGRSPERAGERKRPLTFLLPPNSAFLLGNCDDPSSLRSVAKQAAPRGRFDFLLLDPPWPNRSAVRKSSYNTNTNVRSIKRLLLAMDLDMHIAPGGFIAVWITNRASVRSLVLGPSGLFDAWNVSFLEEWIYLKVTIHGEPVTPIDGSWRKPYEALLIGRAPAESLQLAQPPSKVTRRVILAVPDLHSRKPCLEEIVRRILLNTKPEYYGLEIFARHLVSGWCSWGNEVIKYNWNGSLRINRS